MLKGLLLAGSTLLFSVQSAMAAGPEKEGMPQLNFANPLTISQVVWGALIFVAAVRPAVAVGVAEGRQRRGGAAVEHRRRPGNRA